MLFHLVDYQFQAIIAFVRDLYQEKPFSVKICLVLPLVLLFWRFWRFTVLPFIRPNEPQELPYWFPYLGHVLSFFRDADGTLTYGRKYFGNSREPFTLILAGERVYVITAADDVHAVNINTEQLTFDGYIKDMMNAFGATGPAIIKMFERPPEDIQGLPGLQPNPSRSNLAHMAEMLIRTQLHPGKHLDDLQGIFLKNIHAALEWQSMPAKIMQPSSSAARKVSLLGWTREALLGGATTAFFGPALLELEPNLFDSFFTFDDKSWKLTYKIPAPWSNDMNAAKSKAQNALTAYFNLPRQERTGECWLVRCLEMELRARGIGASDIAAYFMMIYWVINANAWKLCFWTLVYLVHFPSLLIEVREEIRPIVQGSSDPSDMASRLCSCTRTNALYNEVLRLATSSVSVRNVEVPTTIGGKRLRAGSRIIIPYRQLLFDDTVFGHDAKEFNHLRFLKKSSLNRSTSFKPFGDGTTYCPGRFLAKAEVLTFVALALTRFDLRLANDKINDILPRMEIKRPCIGIMGPQEGDDVAVMVTPTLNDSFISLSKTE